MSTVNGPFSGIDRGVAEERLAGKTLEHSTNIAIPVSQTRDDTLLGASEAAAVLGLDRYRSPMSVWLAKRAARAGEPPPVDERPDFVKEAAEWGVALEPVVRGKYALETRSRVLVPGESITQTNTSVYVEGQPWLRCTPDGLVSDVGVAIGGGYVDEFKMLDAGVLRTGFGEVAGLLQVKTCSAYKADEWADGPPPAYEIQCRVEMAVCDLPWCDLVCLIGGQRYVKHRIMRDAKLETNILADLRRFWEHVLDGTPPPVDDSPAWTEYASSKMTISKVVLHADDELRALLVELKQERAARKSAEKAEAGIKNQLLLRLSAAGATVIEAGDLGKVSAYPVAGRVDYKKWSEYLESSLPAAERAKLRPKDDYKAESKTWALRVPRDWGDE